VRKLLVLFLAALSLPAAAGLVYVVDSDYQADVLVYVVDADYQADLLVYVEDAGYQADEDGLWYFVDAEYQAGWKTSHELEGQLH